MHGATLKTVHNTCVYIYDIQTKFHMPGFGSSLRITFKLKLKLRSCYFTNCKKFAQFLQRHYHQQHKGVTGHEVNTKFWQEKQMELGTQYQKPILQTNKSTIKWGLRSSGILCSKDPVVSDVSGQPTGPKTSVN
jgi:hypothetical protein